MSMQITKTSKGYRLTAEQWLPASLDDVFSFFSEASQLENITPPWLNFHIVSDTPIEMGVGTLIDYRLKIHGLPMKWRSEITIWEPPHRFMDVQLRGPYRRWEHLHTFQEQDGGTLVGDSVDYSVPGGGLVHKFFVKPDVKKIFAYRQTALEEFFPATEPHAV